MQDVIIATPTKYPNRVIYGASGPGLDQVDLTPPLDGFFEIVCHGSVGRVTPFVDHFRQVERTPDDLIAFIRSLPQYRGEPLRLLICEAAAGPNSTAQQVATALSRPVVAAACQIYARDLTTVDGSHWCCLTPRVSRAD